MLDKQKPTTKLIKKIGLSKMEFKRVYTNIEAETIPELVAFTLVNLADMDYMMIGQQYEYILSQHLKNNQYET